MAGAAGGGVVLAQPAGRVTGLTGVGASLVIVLLIEVSGALRKAYRIHQIGLARACQGAARTGVSIS